MQTSSQTSPSSQVEIAKHVFNAEDAVLDSRQTWKMNWDYSQAEVDGVILECYRRAAARMKFLEWLRQNIFATGVHYGKIKMRLTNRQTGEKYEKETDKPALFLPGIEVLNGIFNVVMICEPDYSASWDGARARGYVIMKATAYVPHTVPHWIASLPDLGSAQDSVAGYHAISSWGAANVKEEGNLNKAIQMADKRARCSLTKRIYLLSEWFIMEPEHWVDSMAELTGEAPQAHASHAPAQASSFGGPPGQAQQAPLPRPAPGQAASVQRTYWTPQHKLAEDVYDVTVELASRYGTEWSYAFMEKCVTEAGTFTNHQGKQQIPPGDPNQCKSEPWLRNILKTLRGTAARLRREAEESAPQAQVNEADIRPEDFGFPSPGQAAPGPAQAQAGQQELPW